MVEPLPVHTTVAAYRVAVAELPQSTREAHSPVGAIVVVDGGRGWGSRAVAAIDQGARAVVVSSPADTVDLELVASRADKIPVLVERPAVRADVVELFRLKAADARMSLPRLVVAECSGPGSELQQILRDAAAWARIFAGTPLRVDHAAATRHSASVLASTASQPPVTVMMLATATIANAPLIRVRAMGEVAAGVFIDATQLRTELTVADRHGEWRAPPAREGGARVALRRAVAACTSDELPADLSYLAADDDIAATALLPTNQPSH